MTIVDQIKTLEELAAVDAELRTTTEEIAKEREALGSKKAALAKLEEKLKNDRAQLAAIDKLKNDYVIEVRTMMQQIEHSREKMNRSRTERETNAVQRELEELRKLVRDREDEIGRLATDAEASRQSIEGTMAEAKGITDELGESEGAITTRLGKLEADQAEQTKTRTDISKRLPVVLYRRYELVRSKRGTGIAQTTDGTCKACNMSLPPQLFHKLRREPMLEQCPSCNRIIYFELPAQAAAEAKG